MTGLPVQRLRLEYIKGEPVRFVSHLDMMRLWERSCRRAGLPVAHTQGFNPRPRLGMACPLPTGVTSRVELLDIFLTECESPGDALRSLNQALPDGVQAQRCQEVPLGEPALMSLSGTVDYQVGVQWEAPAGDLEEKLQHWMARDSAERVRERKNRRDTYDLRPLVERLWVLGMNDGLRTIGMRLRVGPDGTGRPDEVLKALSLWEVAHEIERTALTLSHRSVRQGK